MLNEEAGEEGKKRNELERAKDDIRSGRIYQPPDLIGFKKRYGGKPFYKTTK